MVTWKFGLVEKVWFGQLCVWQQESLVWLEVVSINWSFIKGRKFDQKKVWLGQKGIRYQEGLVLKKNVWLEKGLVIRKLGLEVRGCLVWLEGCLIL